MISDLRNIMDSSWPHADATGNLRWLPVSSKNVGDPTPKKVDSAKMPSRKSDVYVCKRIEACTTSNWAIDEHVVKCNVDV